MKKLLKQVLIGLLCTNTVFLQNLILNLSPPFSDYQPRLYNSSNERPLVFDEGFLRFPSRSKPDEPACHAINFGPKSIPLATSGVSFSFAFRSIDSDSSLYKYNTVFDLSSGPDQNNIAFYRSGSQESKWKFALHTGSKKEVEFSIPHTPGKINYVVGSLDGSSRTLVIYVNGVKTTTFTFPSANIYDVQVSNSHVGRNSWPDDTCLVADLFYLRIWDSPLSRANLFRELSNPWGLSPQRLSYSINPTSFVPNQIDSPKSFPTNDLTALKFTSGDTLAGDPLCQVLDVGPLWIAPDLVGVVVTARITLRQPYSNNSNIISFSATGGETLIFGLVEGRRLGISATYSGQTTYLAISDSIVDPGKDGNELTIQFSYDNSTSNAQLIVQNALLDQTVHQNFSIAYLMPPTMMTKVLIGGSLDPNGFCTNMELLDLKIFNDITSSAQTSLSPLSSTLTSLQNAMVNVRNYIASSVPPPLYRPTPGSLIFPPSTDSWIDFGPRYLNSNSSGFTINLSFVFYSTQVDQVLFEIVSQKVTLRLYRLSSSTLQLSVTNCPTLTSSNNVVRSRRVSIQIKYLSSRTLVMTLNSFTTAQNCIIPSLIVTNVLLGKSLDTSLPYFTGALYNFAINPPTTPSDSISSEFVLSNNVFPQRGKYQIFGDAFIRFQTNDPLPIGPIFLPFSSSGVAFYFDVVFKHNSDDEWLFSADTVSNGEIGLSWNAASQAFTFTFDSLDYVFPAKTQFGRNKFYVHVASNRKVTFNLNGASLNTSFILSSIIFDDVALSPALGPETISDFYEFMITSNLISTANSITTRLRQSTRITFGSNCQLAYNLGRYPLTFQSAGFSLILTFKITQSNPHVLFNANSNTLELKIHFNSTNLNALAFTDRLRAFQSFAVPLNVMVTMALIVDPINGQMRFIVQDPTIKTAVTNNLQLPDHVFDAIYVGRGASLNDGCFQGVMYDFRIYDQSLSLQQLLTLGIFSNPSPPLSTTNFASTTQNLVSEDSSHSSTDSPIDGGILSIDDQDFSLLIDESQTSSGTMKSNSIKSSSLTSQRQENFVEQFVRSTGLAFPVVIIIFVTGFLFIFVLVLSIIIKLRKRSKIEKSDTNSNTTYSDVNQTSVMSSGQTSMMGTTTTMMKTVVNTSFELSIPSFLEKTIDVDFKISNKQIAKGGGGSIYLGLITNKEWRNQVRQEQVIVKVVSKDLDSMQSELKVAFFQELSLMHQLRNHVNFVKVYGYSAKPACFILKFYPAGSLTKFIYNNSQIKYSKTTIMILLKTMTQGISILHRMSYAHCDLKPDNILLEKQQRSNRYNAIITDFGVAQVLENLSVKAFQKSEVLGGSLAYAAPEVLLRIKQYKQEPSLEEWLAQDLYSLGIIFYEILNRKLPRRNK